jgi:hypothetical protein
VVIKLGIDDTKTLLNGGKFKCVSAIAKRKRKNVQNQRINPNTGHKTTLLNNLIRPNLTDQKAVYFCFPNPLKSFKICSKT